MSCTPSFCEPDPTSIRQKPGLAGPAGLKEFAPNKIIAQSQN